LYWARRGDQVRFASEMFTFDRSWRSAVEAFPPGHYWTPERGLQAFAEAVPADGGADARREPGPEDLEETREALIESVHRQMMGDVPVGVFLSGGLDSTLIAAIAARRYAEEG